MKQVLSLAVVAAVALTASFAGAADIESGLKEGKFVGAFYVTKLAGASDDGVSVGKNLCYRCKNGGRPQVMVFTRSTDPKVQQLVKKLDGALAKNSSKELRAFVNCLSDSKASAEKAAKALAANTDAKHVPFVVPNEFENGPADYGINAKADITILMAAGGQVKMNYAVASAKDMDVDAVVNGLSKILK